MRRICAIALGLRFQSTLPARGATEKPPGKSGTGTEYFNPRSPRGERPMDYLADLVARGISIHAPREGSDFQVRPVQRGQTISIHAPREGSDTQERSTFDRAKFISIHAPREGSDRCRSGTGRRRFRFQSTLPARGATAKMHNNLSASLAKGLKFLLRFSFSDASGSRSTQKNLHSHRKIGANLAGIFCLLGLRIYRIKVSSG